ncbi:uncharacterized protein LOC143022030 [Oratosquilla oratoria]|uniref:uncharacterized protein LOC143022030 n=1 Tax=Oratosquilla oratoria TaxID=337810 RepID=UPI003F766260
MISVRVPTACSIDAPDGPPRIKGLSPFYHVADVININCSSIRSRPAATLHWTVNRNRVMEDAVIVYPTVSEDHEDMPLYTATLGLRLPAQRSLFVHDFLHVKCTANIQGYEWISEGTAQLSNDTYAQPHHLPTLTLKGRGSSSGSSLNRHTARSLSSLLGKINEVCLQMLLLVLIITKFTGNPQFSLCIT